MEAAHAPETEVKATASQDTVASPRMDNARKCLVSGAMLPKSDLIRFVVGPDNAVVPDLAQNLPGRGLWVKADFAAITTAAQKGIFAKAAKAPAKAAPDLAETVVKLLRARCLSLMGMAKGAGITVLGQPQVETAIRAHKLGLLLLADDAKSELDRRNPIQECHLFTRDELGAALGYAQIVYAGLKPHGLTDRLKSEINRLTALLAPASETTTDTAREMDQ